MTRSFLSLLVIISASLSPAVSNGQSLNTILDKLHAVEKRLEEIDIESQNVLLEKNKPIAHLIAFPDTAHNEVLSRIHDKVEELRILPGTFPLRDNDTSKRIEPVDEHVDRLELKLVDLRDAAEKDDHEQLGLIVADLNGLVGGLRTSAGNADIMREPMQQEFSAAEAPGINISGFGDFLYSFGASESQDTPINIGQVELDIETGVSEQIGFVGALVYDAGTESICLGDLYLDFNLIGNENQILSVAGIEKGGVKVGQFDIPFGIDFNYYPSIERKLVSRPLVVENTHACWGDFGVQIYNEGTRYNVAVYGVNGFGYENSAGKEISMKISSGGRVGLKPVQSIEIGGSYAGFFNENMVNDMVLAGVDVQAQISALSIKGEYIEHQIGIKGNDDETNTGYYFEGIYDFGKYFAVARYGAFVPEGGAEMIRTSAGLGYVVREGLEFRLEYQVNNLEVNRTYFQMVMGI